MKIIITGGTGFLGRSLIARLRASDHDVVVLTRDPARTAGTLPPGVTVAHWDGATAGEWRSHVDGADAIINLAGESIGARRWTRRQKDRIVRSRVDAASALYQAVAAARKRPSVLVNASAVGYYGAVDEGDVTEEHPAGSGFLADTCVQWEKAARTLGDLGLRVVLLRFGVVLGDDGGALGRMVVPFRLYAGGPIGSGKQWFPWIHRSDLVNVVLFALQNSAVDGPVNVTAPESVTMQSFCAALGKALRRPSWAPVPAPVLRILLGEMAEMVLTGQRVAPAKLRNLGFQFSFPSLATALTDIFP